MDTNDIFINSNNYFEKYKSILLEKFASYYGEQYRNIIFERISSTYIDFSSSPIEDFNYSFSHQDTIGEDLLNMIERKFNIYKELSVKTKDILIQRFIDFLLREIKIKNSNNIIEHINIFTNMFSCNVFNKSYIDAFTTNSTDLLNTYQTPSSIKDNIILKQKMFNRINLQYNFGLNEPSTFIADKITEVRDKILKEYEYLIAQKCEYGQNILMGIKNFHNIKLSPDELSYITFIPNAYHGNIGHANNDSMEWYSFIRIPLTLLFNNRVRSIDVSVIHEFIHCIESFGWYVGIESHVNGENKISNEIRTQKLALEITEELHEEGIFIFDDPKNYRLGGQSTYEWLFPISLDFFNKYEEIFKDCAIRNDRTLLVNNFGLSWKIYSHYLEEIYNKFMEYNCNVENTTINFNVDNTYSNLIDDMESHYNNISNLQKPKIYTYYKK